MTEKFTNIANIIGKVKDKSWNEWVGDGKKLGNLTMNVGDDRIYVDMFNPNSANRNVVQEFFNDVRKGETVKIRGNMEERQTDDGYRRAISPFISATKGVVSYTKLSDDTTTEPKATLALDVDVLENELKYNNLDRFSGKDTAITELTVAYFNLYNPDGDEEPTRKEILNRQLQNFYEYNKENDTDVDLEMVENMGKELDELETVPEVLRLLKRFYDEYEPRMFNIDILHLVSYSVVDEGDDLAETLAEDIGVTDNVRLGCIISNKIMEDEFGFVDGNVNEIEVKKFKGINESYDQDVPFGADDESEDDWGF